MKRGWKNFWRMNFVILLLGISCLILAVAMGFRAEKIDSVYWQRFAEAYTQAKEDKESELVGDTICYKNITDMEIEISAGTLQILQGESEEIQIDATEYLDHGDNICNVKEKNGKLTVKCCSGLGINAGTVKIYVPAEYELKSLQLEIDSTKAEVEELCAETIEIENKKGSVLFSGKVTEKADEYVCQVQAETGTVVFDGKEYRKTSGTVHYGKAGEKELQLDCEEGTVKVQFDGE